jgi:DNA ligase 4
MLKDPNSTYVPKERSTNWLKLKGDYVEGMTESMDVIILGGYFGDHSFRLGTEGSHWTNQVTSFLVGVLESNSEDNKNSKIPYALPFSRIGMGFSGEDLVQIRARIKHNLYQYNGKGKPEWMHCQWNWSKTNKVDCYIKDLTQSIVLEVKGAELIGSTNFATDCAIRFGRNIKIRFDKDWNEAMTKEQLDAMHENAQFTKTMKRKN